MAGTYKFQIIDSTLREGEQYQDAYFTTRHKIDIALALDKFGVDFIEVTNPAASPRCMADCATLCSLSLRKSKVVGHIRCHMNDAKAAIQAGLKHVNVMIGTSKHMQRFSHGKDMAQITKEAIAVTEFLRSHGVEVRFSGEDAFRSDIKALVKLYQTMEASGVSRVGIPDTVGCATPDDVTRVVSAVRKAVSVDIETHFHNDTGCAIANAYMAVKAGATHVDTTVLG
ncbi:putative AC transposase [Purpureocillium lavendulum]|uniref:AC transposase n=1 Tax=Purpureocillium lavendulum TaxID=1247861 RepID=A0AB34FFN3_9HYPO|nr:putative AC transposase [Purpureocillium lavendulum]